MPALVAPTTTLHTAWLASYDEWGAGVHQDGAGLRPGDEVRTPAGFTDWVARLHRQADPTVPVADGWVHCSYWWVVESGEVLGAVALRHELNDHLLQAGGHIGYGIRPSARRRGLATWAVSQVLPQARALGLDQVLITCQDGNVASARVIELSGGVLEDVRDAELGRLRRYWLPVP
jgi:predicted acetyltransferase